MARLTTSSLSILSAALLLVGLTGCAIATPAQDDTASGRQHASSSAPAPSTTGRNPSVAPSTSASAGDDETVDCGVTPEVRLNQPGIEYRLIGDCETVTIEGQDIEVDAAGVGALTIRGDRNSIDADDIATATVSGTENEIDARAIGTAEISGERNDLDVDGAIDVLTISGNDNEVDAGTIGEQSVAGDRNEITLG